MSFLETIFSPGHLSPPRRRPDGKKKQKNSTEGNFVFFSEQQWKRKKETEIHSFGRRLFPDQLGSFVLKNAKGKKTFQKKKYKTSGTELTCRQQGWWENFHPRRNRWTMQAFGLSICQIMFMMRRWGQSTCWACRRRRSPWWESRWRQQAHTLDIRYLWLPSLQHNIPQHF